MKKEEEEEEELQYLKTARRRNFKFGENTF